MSMDSCVAITDKPVKKKKKISTANTQCALVQAMIITDCILGGGE